MKSDQKLLRKLNPDKDAEALHAIFGDEICCLFLPEPAAADVAGTRALLQRLTKGTEETSWAIVEDNKGPALGRVSLIPEGNDIWEVAIMLVPSATGRGLATRATAQALDKLFERTNARRVYADCDPDNLSSIAIFERLGFTKEGHLRATWSTHTGICDSIIYALINTDNRPWLAD
jgi:RimJ/RimL family protein N-acetyltransferase